MSAGVERKRKAAALELLASSSSAPQEALYGITELCAEFSLTPRASSVSARARNGSRR